MASGYWDETARSYHQRRTRYFMISTKVPLFVADFENKFPANDSVGLGACAWCTAPVVTCYIRSVTIYEGLCEAWSPKTQADLGHDVLMSDRSRYRFFGSDSRVVTLTASLVRGQSPIAGNTQGVWMGAKAPSSRKADGAGCPENPSGADLECLSSISELPEVYLEQA